MSANENLIVVAGAGTGKTYKLVQTCVEKIRAGAGIDEVLIVTFTKAAAAELRSRIGAALQEAFAKEPHSNHLALQIALLDRAQISTLHSFCLDLVSRHFSELGLSPRIATLEEAQAAALESQTLDELFETYYEAESKGAAAAKELILQWFRGDAAEVRRIVRKIHGYTQARPNAREWFARQRAIFSARPPAYLRELHETAVREWAERTRPIIEAQPVEGNPARAALLNFLDKFNVAEFARAGEEKTLWPHGTKGKYCDPLEKIFADASMLRDWMPHPEGDPLADDWELTRATTLGLLRIAEDFGEAFGKVKRERGLVDFNDLEQFSLQLLWEDGKPSAAADYWRKKLKWIFVDEYQDINPAQDRIIAALAREGDAGNRFLVGDVKQSIYGFRQAEPKVFVGYTQEWSDGRRGARADLTRNWRSHERILEFVNGLFGSIMRLTHGGVEYDERACLKFADEPGRENLSARSADGARVEFHFLNSQKEEQAEASNEGSLIAELKDAEREAEMIAQLCLELAEQGRASFDDIVILMRSPANAVEAFAKIFSRRGIPFDARRTGFFSCIEALDLMNLLTILDNPLQDIPLLGVLRSPIGGFSFEDLAAVRIGTRGSFWHALLKAASARVDGKAAAFVKQYNAWRDLARETSLAQRLEIILEESGYEDWAAAQERGAQRRANVRRLVELARQFDELRGEGLYPFLNYLQEQLDAVGDLAPASVASQGAVRLMSVHQSKGLEFPVVIMAGLQKKFNRQDLNGVVLLDEELGLCVKARPPGTRGQFETLPFWVAKQRLDQKLRDEEMRILYVALTRAKERLLLVASAEKGAREKWKNATAPGRSANCALDWIGPWLHVNCDGFLEAAEGEGSSWRWKLHASLDLDRKAPLAAAPENWDTATVAAVQRRLEWRYPFEAATRQEAKSSATALRRALADEPELARPIATRPAKPNGLKGAEAGQAAHRFLEAADLPSLASVESIRAELDRLENAGVLSEAEAESIDPRKMALFWTSDFGKDLLKRPERLRRELIFTARFSAADLRAVGAPVESDLPDEEFIVVQGAADLAAIHEKEIWLVDFKTDRMPKARREEYALQLRIYMLALSRVYKRPVTWACLHFLETGETDWIRQPGYLPLM